MDGPSATLAAFSENLPWDDVPQEVRSIAKVLLVDSIGCALGGRHVAKGRIPVELARTWGQDEATIIGDKKSSIPAAAFANGELMNALDMDAILTPGHITPYVLPTVLALAESRHVRGTELLRAVVIAHEVGARVASAYDPLRTLEETPQGLSYKLSAATGYGSSITGAALAGALLLGLRGQQLTSCLGVAGYMTPVPALSKYLRGERSPHVKYTSAGWVAMGATMAALLVEQGYSGDASVLDGEFGLGRMFASSRSDERAMVHGLGERWLILESEIKPYPSFRMGHPAIESFIDLLRTRRIAPESIESITLAVDPISMSPLYLNNDISNHTDAQLSWAYVLGAAAYYPPGPAWQTPEALGDPRIRALMRKVHVTPQMSWAGDLRQAVHEGRESIATPFSIPVDVSVRVDGRSHRAEPKPFPKGHPRRPMTEDEIRGKFLANASVTLAEDASRALWERLADIEGQTDVADVLELAGSGGQSQRN